MLEKDIENLIAEHPDEIFPGEEMKLIGQQVVVEGRRLDILFEDKHKRQVIIEVKRGILTREASGQIAEYYGLLKNANKDKIFELILCANIIPKERRTFLEMIGIECKELGILQVTELAEKYNYTFIDDRPESKKIDIKNIKDKNKKIGIQDKKVEGNVEASVWVFQGNPNRYDILNALSDNEVGNSIHWLVKQNRNKIHKGHLALIWMSGKEAGIYALGRIECEPAIMKEKEEERKYWLGDDEKIEANRVRITILKRFLNKPIFRKDLIEIPELQNISIIKQSQGTNFPIEDFEWNVLSELI